MKIRDILAEGKPTLSFEVFPPKTQDAFASVEKAAEEMARLASGLYERYLRRRRRHQRLYCKDRV